MVADATGFRNRDVAHLNQISACSRNVTHDFCCCGSTTGKVSIEADGSRFSNVHLTFSGNVAAGRLSDDIALKMDTLLRVAVNKGTITLKLVVSRIPYLTLRTTTY
jgi:hypothetical protein